MTPEIQAFVTIGGFIITAYSFYTNLKNKSVEQAKQITALELKENFLCQRVDANERRIDELAQQNKALISMAEQMKYFSQDLKELKDIIKEGKF